MIHPVGHVDELVGRHPVPGAGVEQPAGHAHLQRRGPEDRALQLLGEHVEALDQKDGQPVAWFGTRPEDHIGLGEVDGPLTEVVVQADLEAEPGQLVEAGDAGTTPEGTVGEVHLVTPAAQAVGELVQRRHAAHRQRRARAHEVDDHDAGDRRQGEGGGKRGVLHR